MLTLSPMSPMCRRSSWSATSAALEVATFCLQLADAPDCCCSKRSELALLECAGRAAALSTVQREMGACQLQLTSVHACCGTSIPDTDSR